MAQNKTQFDTRTLNIDKNIVENIDNGLIVLDSELTIYHYNRWLELHTKHKESEIIGEKLYEVFPEINLKTLKRKIKTALRLKTPTFYTAATSKYLIPIKLTQLKHIHFEYMQQDVSIVPLNGNDELVALILTDQTNMATTNALLKANIKKVKELNAELIKERETINQKVLLLKLDIDAVVVDLSEALLNLLGYKKYELVGLNFFDFEKLHLTPDLIKNISEYMSELKVFEFEQVSLTVEGREVWFKSSLVPEYDPRGKHIGFILFRENITASKNLIINHEKMLANSRSAAMGEMVGMIAHQWRQPLSLINTIIATIKIEEELGTLEHESMHESFEKIETTTQFLSETIDDFREYFKPNKIVSEVNIEALFTKSIYFLTDEMRQSNITYKTDIDKDITIRTYKNELIQTIINIIKNSMDAFAEHPEIKRSKYIEIEVTKEKTHLSILMRDNAGGIAKEILSHVFEPYFSTKSKNGTGLGLYMCHTIITEHLKGDITITSASPYTTTLIELPYEIQQKEKPDENSMSPLS